MKVGLSYSRCILDIVENRVNADDVLVVIARTNFDPTDDEQWKDIWRGYCFGGGFSSPEWSNYEFDNKEHEDKFRSVSIMLWEDGKIHQPRKFGAYAVRRPGVWLETVLPSGELEKNPAAKTAWDQFQVVAGLSGISLDKKYQ